MIKQWLLTRKWLWKKVIFDNGVVGKNYHRYDHLIYHYSQGMGNNGEYGDVNTAIKITLNYLNHINNCFEKRTKLKSVSSDISELIFYAKNTSSANVSHKMPSIMYRLNEIDKKLKDILYDEDDDRTDDEKKLNNFMNNYK